MDMSPRGWGCPRLIRGSLQTAKCVHVCGIPFPFLRDSPSELCPELGLKSLFLLETPVALFPILSQIHGCFLALSPPHHTHYNTPISKPTHAMLREAARPPWKGAILTFHSSRGTKASPFHTSARIRKWLCLSLADAAGARSHPRLLQPRGHLCARHRQHMHR